MALIACDLDGTLILNGGNVDLASREAVRRGTWPDRDALRQARALAHRHLFAYVTERPPQLRSLTLMQLRVHAPWPAGPIHFMPTWTREREVARWKARVLETVGADAFVGDEEVDEEAAKLAGCMFVEASEFRQHGITPQNEAAPPARAPPMCVALPRSRPRERRSRRGDGFAIVDATTEREAPRPIEESYGRLA